MDATDPQVGDIRAQHLLNGSESRGVCQGHAGETHRHRELVRCPDRTGGHFGVKSTPPFAIVSSASDSSGAGTGVQEDTAQVGHRQANSEPGECARGRELSPVFAPQFSDTGCQRLAEVEESIHVLGKVDEQEVNLDEAVPEGARDNMLAEDLTQNRGEVALGGDLFECRQSLCWARPPHH